MKTVKKHMLATALALAVSFVIAGLFCSMAKNDRAPAASQAEDLSVSVMSGETSVIVPSSDTYTIIFSSDNNQMDGTIATELRSTFASSGTMLIMKSDMMEPTPSAHEILIGNTDRQLSKDLRDACIAAVKNDSLVWGFAYRDGSFAYAASSDPAFARGRTDLMSRFIKDGTMTVENDLWLLVSLSRAEYEAELKAEADRLEAEKEAARQKQIDDLKAAIGSFSFSDFTDYVTLDYTVMPESSWGSPALYPTPGQHPRLNVTAYMLDDIRAYINDTDEGAIFYENLLALADTQTFDGILDAAYTHTSGRKGYHNMNEKGLAIIEARAFVYLITGDELYGYNAVLSMKNYLKTIDIGWIHSDQCREFGRILYCTAEIYDWCYDLLTETDKNQFMVAMTDICASKVADEYSGLCQSGDRQMEVGYPPSGQGSVSGHGSEHQILRDYLAAAIAIFDENPSWYEYVGGRVYNDYIVTRNYYYQSGTYQQGIFNYGPFRHNADIWSAWILLCATGENPYVDDLQRITNSFFEYELPNGTFFGTGDGSRPTSPSGRMINNAILISALYGDMGLWQRASDYYAGFRSSSLTGNSIDMSMAHMLILGTSYYQKTGTTEGDDIYEGKAVVSYHSYPIGQMIARSEWNNENAPAIFMKIGEKSTANHEHADAGTFQIFYKGLYSGESGVYDKYGSSHFSYYHQATVAHNGLLIFNPANAEYSLLEGETVDTATNLEALFYSGGQRREGESATLQSWLNDAKYDTGEVTGYEYIINADSSADYAYLAGDITAAYSINQASYVGRRMLTVFTDDEKYPMFFVVYDSIDSMDDTFVNKFLLHTPTEPVINEGEKTVTLTAGSGRLVLHSLKGGDKIEMLGGDGKNYLINGVQCALSTTGNDKMWGRVELSNTGATSSEFLSFMYVTDADNDEKLAPTKFESDLLIGTQIDDTVVVFARSTERNSEELVFNASGTGLNRYFVSGLYEGTWDISVDGLTVAHRVSTVEGGMICFYAPAGEVHVKPGKDIAPSNGGRIIYNAFGGIVPDNAPQTYEVGVTVTLPENIERGNDIFLGWYTSPKFEEDTKVTELVPYDKGKINVYAKYRSFPVIEDFESRNFAFGETTKTYGDLKYAGASKAGSWFETLTDSTTGNKYLAMYRAETDMQLDAMARVGEYIGSDTAITFEIDLARNGDKIPMSSSFRLRESSNKQTVSLFNTAVDGSVTFGSTTLISLTEEFQRVIITVDFAAGKIYAYDLFGEKISTRSFGVPSASSAASTLDWMYSLSYTFNWWIGGGESILVDNVKVYGGEYDANNVTLPEGTGRIIYKASMATLPAGYPLTFKVGETVTLPIPTVSNGEFLGWYTDPSFNEDSKITEINATSTDPVTVYAKCSVTVLESDFTGSTVDVSEASKSIGGIFYQFSNKAGSYAKAVTESNGNTYIKIYTAQSSDPSINCYAAIADAISSGGGKITYAIDLAAAESERYGSSNFRLRASSSSDILTLFTTTGEGDIMLGGSLNIGKLSTSFQKVIITLDVNASTITAYDPYGIVIGTKAVAPPSVSGITTVAEWINEVTCCFNWHISGGGGIAFDNIKIFSGEYVPLIEEIPENSYKVTYQTGGGSFAVTPEKYVSNEQVFTLPTDITLNGGIFLGWYTSPSFEEGTLITEIPEGNTSEYNVFAKWQIAILSNDFTGSSVDVSEVTKTVDKLQYMGQNKTGTYFKATSDGSGNTYIKVYTDGNDGTVNSFVSIAGAATSGGGKITYTIDLATHEDGRSGATNFRIRSQNTNNVVNLFTTSGGKVYLAGDSAKPIATLSTEFQRISITLDAANYTVTAYDIYGDVLASAGVKVPTASTASSLLEWLDTANYAFNWHISDGGGIAFDNINIYAGSYVPETEVIPDGHVKVVYQTGGGTFAEVPGRYASVADGAYTLPTDITKEGMYFMGWYTTETFDDGTLITEIPQGANGTYTLYAAWGGKIFEQTFTGLEGAKLEEKNGALSSSGLSFTANGQIGASLEVVKDENGNEYLVFSKGEDGNDPQLRRTTGFALGADKKATFHISLALPAEGECVTADFRVRKYVTDDSGTRSSTDFLLIKISDGKVYLSDSTDVIAELGADFTDITVTFDGITSTLTAYSTDGTVLATKSLNATKYNAEWFDGLDTPIYIRATSGDAIKIDNIWLASGGFSTDLFE